MARRPADSAPDERAVRHRSSPGTALRNLDDAADFLKQMGLLLQTPHPYLPSLFGAAQGKPVKPGVAGFGQWPEHAWSWAGELAEHQDVVLTKLLLGKRTLVHQRLWKALDAAVRGRPAVTEDEKAIVGVLAGKGSLRRDKLRGLAGLDDAVGRNRYDKAMTQLETRGIVLCTPALVDNHKHVTIAELWTSKFPKPLSKSHGVDALVLAAVQASGPVPAREIPRWFAWPRDETTHALDALVSKGELGVRDGLLSAERRADA